MFEHQRLQKLEDYFVTLDQRRERGIYFYRINGCNKAIREFLGLYYDSAG